MTDVLRAPANPDPTAFKRARALALRHAPARAPTRGGERPLFATLALLASTALFPMSDMLAKTLTGDLPALEVAWMRYVVLVLALVPFAIRNRAAMITRRPGLQIMRGTASAVATAIAIVAFSLLPVADATAIGFITPVIVTALAAVLLKEAVGWPRWLAAGLGFAGIMVIVQPGGSTFQPATLIPLVGAVFGAGSAILTRAVKNERIDTTLIYSAVVGFVLLSGVLPALWHRPTLQQVETGVAMGLLSAAATLAQVLAYRFASASLLAPFSYSQLVWAGALGWLVFGTVPGAAMLAGCGIIVSSGLLSAGSGRLGRHRPALFSRDAGEARPRHRALLIPATPIVSAR